MKRIIIISIILFLGLAYETSSAQPYDTQPYTNYGGTELFYSQLAPYGTWIQLDNGLVVWRPLNLQPGWAPYKYGYWIWTNDGWYWHSDDPFGYIVFHYGRWYYDNYYGWLWVPDDVWAPAWVQWRYDNDYIGWAPLPPYASFSINFGVRFSMSFNTPYYHWHFLRYRYMCNPYAYNYYVPDRTRYRLYSITKYRTNYGYSNGRVINRGVDVDFIRKKSGARITEHSIDRVNNLRDIGNGRNITRSSVRAYIVSRNSISGSNLRNMDIQRGARPSSLNLSRITIGDRNLIGRGNNRSAYDSRAMNRTSRGNAPQGDIRTMPNRAEPGMRVMPKQNDNYLKRDVYKAPQINRSRPQGNNKRIENRSFQRRIERSPQPRSYRPQIRQENRSRQVPQMRRESRNNNSNRGGRRDSGHRIRR